MVDGEGDPNTSKSYADAIEALFAMSYTLKFAVKKGELAIDYGCYFAIDSDAHATGQLEWQPLGCNRAAECEVPLERVINTWAVDDLLRWVSAA